MMPSHLVAEAESTRALMVHPLLAPHVHFSPQACTITRILRNASIRCSCCQQATKKHHDHAQSTL